RRRPLPEPLDQLLTPSDDGRPVRRPERQAARRPRQEQLVERGRHLVPAQLEDVLAVLEEAVLREQGAELPHLVPPAREEPVVAEELVLLHIRKDHARKAEQLVEGLPRPVIEECAVFLGEAVALARDVPARTLGLL